MNLDSDFSDIPNSPLAELRALATRDDIVAHAHYQRTLESLETRYAEGVFAAGGVVRALLEDGSGVVSLCLTMAQFDTVQAYNRKHRGW